MTRQLYLDTNIFSMLLKHGDTSGFTTWMRTTAFELNLSGILLIEISAVVDHLPQLRAALGAAPTRVLVTPDDLLAAEVRGHPHGAGAGAAQAAFVAGALDVDALLRTLRRAGPQARAEHLAYAAATPARHAALRDNFPPGPSGRYTRDQAPLFASMNVAQTLLTSGHAGLARQADFRPEAIASQYLRALVIFWEYYLRTGAPNETSDLGDLSHLGWYPYFDVVVTERRMAATLNEVKRAFGVPRAEILTVAGARSAGWLT